MVHVAYTSDDENHLIHYLATHNPDGKGRRGNALYRRLTDNADGQWSWSARHSWQSWRDHYVKNEAIMNKRIKIYQKRGGTDEVKEGKRKEKLATNYSHKRQDREQNKKRIGSSDPEDAQKHFKRKRVATAPDTATAMKKRQKREESDVGIPMTKSCHPLSMDKEKHEVLNLTQHSSTSTTRSRLDEERKDEDEDEEQPFQKRTAEKDGSVNAPRYSEDTEEVKQILTNFALATSSGLSDFSNGPRYSPLTTEKAGFSSGRITSSVARKIAARPTSTLSECSFDSLFDSDPDKVAPDSEEEEAIDDGSNNFKSPAYHGHVTEGFFYTSSTTKSSLEPIVKSHPTSSQTASAKGKRALPRLREGPFITTFAGSSTRTDHSENSDEARVADTWPPIRRRKPRVSSSPREARAKKMSAEPRQLGRNASGNHYKISHSMNSIPGTSGPDNLGSSDSSTSRCLTSLRQSHWNNRSSPQRALQDSGEGKQYRTEQPSQEGDLDADRSEPVNLQQDMRNSLLLQPSIDSSDKALDASTNVRSISSQSPPLSIQLPMQDRSLVASLGMKQAVALMSTNHGFTEQVVSEILQNVKSISKTDEILRRMRISAEEVGINAILQVLDKKVDNSGLHQTAAKQLMIFEPNELSSSGRKHLPSRKAQNLQVQVTSDEQLSDYSPPHRSRAGQFTRLIQQGRRIEAVAREARRASGSLSPKKPSSNISEKTARASYATPSVTEPVAIKGDALFKEQPMKREAGETNKSPKGVYGLRNAHAAALDVLREAEAELGPTLALQRTGTFLGELLTRPNDR
ncbi:hypothetical protein AX17_001885 [Amanita inopinata Kibby_2008]|nr:hypothetical protein AX17_001885 [Amanita inopinata Kibby_2008]